MKLITWTDKDGFQHRSWVRDQDPEEMAEQGILQDPPNLEALDWEGIKRDLHNALMDAGLYSWRDVQNQGAADGLRGAILSSIKRRLITLYREAQDG